MRMHGHLKRGLVAALACAALAAVGAGAAIAAASSNPFGIPTGNPFGTHHAAHGKSIVLGMINDEGGVLGSFPELHQGAEAALDYINAYKGGVGGRPLSLDYCASTGDASSSASCATQLIGHHPVAFEGGADFGTTGSVPVLRNADLALLGGATFGLAETTYANARIFEGFGDGVFAGLAAYAVKVLHAKNVAVIYSTAAGGLQVGDTVIKDPLLGEGVSAKNIEMIPQNGNSTDFTASMAAAAADHPNAIIAITTVPQCVSSLEVHAQVASSIPLLVPSACIPELSTVGSAANGVYMSSDVDPPGSPTPEVELFEAAMKKYEPKAPLDEFAQVGFASAMNIWREFNSIGANKLTTKRIIAAFDKGTQPNFMSLPFDCDHSIPAAPSICNGAERILQIRNGEPVQVNHQWYNGSQYVGKS
jgi:branched-chain amino acid transport system substrate-binding protein